MRRGLRPGRAGGAGSAATWHAGSVFLLPACKPHGRRGGWVPAGSALAAARTLSAAGWVPRSAPAPPPLLGDCSRLRVGKDLTWRKPSLVGKTSGLLHGQTSITHAGEVAAPVARTRPGCTGTVPGQGLDWQRGLLRAEFDLHGAGKHRAEPGGEEERGEYSPLRVSGDGWVLPRA